MSLFETCLDSMSLVRTIVHRLPKDTLSLLDWFFIKTGSKVAPCLLFRLWSDYRKSLPGQCIRIRLNIEQKNCRLFLDVLSSAIMNDLFVTFTSRLKVDAKCVYQQWNWITVANYFWTPPADWVDGYLYFEPGAWIWTKRFRRYLHVVKTDLEIFL